MSRNTHIRRPDRTPKGRRTGRQLIPAVAASVAVAALLVALPARAADSPEAQVESVRGVGTFERDPIGVELDRLLELPFDLADGGQYDPDEERPYVLSTFTVFPKFEIDLIHTDNIFRSSSNAKSDIITLFRPIVSIESDWDNHSLVFTGQADIGRHIENTIEDYEDYSLSTAFTIDVDDFTTASGNIGHSRSHGQRGDIDDPGQQLGTDIQHQTTVGFSAARAIPDGLELDGAFSATRVTVDDNGPIDNSDRARTDYNARVRMGWEIEQGTSVFVQPAATFSRFHEKLDNFGVNRDFNDYELTAGVRLDPSPITFLEFLAGLTQRKFADASFQDGTDYLVRGLFLWNPTPVTTVNGSIDQTFSPASTPGISGTLTRTYSTSVDWTPRDPVILSAQATFRTEDFEGSTPERSRQSIILGLSADWAIDRNFYTSIGVTTEHQSGDLAIDDMVENRIQVRLGGQL